MNHGVDQITSSEIRRVIVLSPITEASQDQSRGDTGFQSDRSNRKSHVSGIQSQLDSGRR